MKKGARIFSVVLGVVFLLLLLFGWAMYQINVPQNKNDQALYDVVVKKGDGLAEVAEKLEEQGVVRQSVLFRYAMIVSGKASSIQVGNYELTPDASINETIAILTGGEVTQEGSVTIQEGLNNEQIADLLADYFVEHSTSSLAFEEERVRFRDEFLAEMNNLEKYRAEYTFLEDVPEGGTLEGFLFPDTYRFFKETEAEVVVRKMLDNFDAQLSRELRVEIASQGKTIFEVVTLAAIVQREVPEEYMKDVAGIFYNRLAIGMKLQSDATVNYVTEKDRPQPSFEDVEVDSLYNTYKYAGLPPGPISNPGIAAIESTVFPNEHDYFFFLTTLDTGEAIFSKTGTEHLQNKEKYLD
jgi:UPF0755 protein